MSMPVYVHHRGYHFSQHAAEVLYREGLCRSVWKAVKCAVKSCFHLMTAGWGCRFEPTQLAQILQVVQ